MNFKKKIIAITPFISVIAFIILTYFGYAHPGWMVFLLIPIVPFLVGQERIRFSYPLIVTAAYLAVGLFTKFEWRWNLGWVIFLTIPIYYILITPKSKITFKSSKNDKFFEDDSL
ncbi:MAG: hypothetical protein PHO86_03140 [Bacilli bacterium]|nr:hypothetical protein [Bacilli bacterium]